MSELDKLEEYLKKYNIPYERIDEEGIFNRHQILVKDEDGVVIWDAVCHFGSYGYKEGLLEIMGTLVRPEDRDSVAGWLTAEDVIKRIESRQGERERMTLDEAIKHCEEVAEEYEQKLKDNPNAICYTSEFFECAECASEHRQLAEWLKELKKLRAEQKDVYEKGYEDGYCYALEDSH